MITFKKLGEHGRLGNQLFQYAALRSLGLENGYVMALPDFSTKEWDGQKCLLREFNILNRESNFKPEHNYIEPSENEFDPMFFRLLDGVNIHGFFQNLKYFDKHREVICKELTLKDQYLKRAEHILGKYKSLYPNHDLVTLHIRRGDAMRLDLKFYNLFGLKGYALDPQSQWARYFENSKKVFGSKVKYLVFTGGNTNNNDESDFRWVRENLGKDCILAGTSDPLMDYALMYCCDNNILSYSSTFGWWAAYSNLNPNKKVVMPKNYFVDGRDSSRITPNNWLTF